MVEEASSPEPQVSMNCDNNKKGKGMWPRRTADVCFMSGNEHLKVFISVDQAVWSGAGQMRERNRYGQRQRSTPLVSARK